MPQESDFGYLEGQLLIAMPGMSDDRFARSVIYLCAHSAEGAMGIVINKPAPDLRLTELLVQLEIIDSDDAIRLPAQIEAHARADGRPCRDKPRLRSAQPRLSGRAGDHAGRWGNLP